MPHPPYRPPRERGLDEGGGYARSAPSERAQMGRSTHAHSHDTTYTHASTCGAKRGSNMLPSPLVYERALT